ncbi:MAG: hypothetical protein BA863_02405 [Desulfovibrio sp. S3730MH75]|nr:MAG: hypothetical protein BA863_02405 [Desulfovibrio sp. S3730MH75]
MVENYYLNREFKEFEEYAESLRLWNIQIRKLQRGETLNILKQLNLGDVHLSYGLFAGKTHQVGISPPERTFAFHDGKNSSIVWRNENVPSNGLMIFPNTCELDIVTKGTQNNVYTISIPDTSLFSEFEARQRNINHKLGSTPELIHIPIHYVSRLKSLFRSCFRAIDDKPGLTTSAAFEQDIREEILNTFSLALSTKESCSTQPIGASKSNKWKKIEKILKLSIDSPIKVHDLSQKSGVSERTLRRLFHDRFGISPKTYLCRIRLNGVRHNLRKSTPFEVNVVDIANAWGFWHSGQFAADYKQLFGELPSTTLKGSEII